MVHFVDIIYDAPFLSLYVQMPRWPKPKTWTKSLNAGTSLSNYDTTQHQALPSGWNKSLKAASAAITNDKQGNNAFSCSLT